MMWKFDAERIRWARETKDMTQADLAGVIGVSTQQVSAWETGLNTPGQESLMKIVNALNIKPKFFYVQCVSDGNNDGNNAA